MAIKINNLPSAVRVNGTDQIVVEQSDGTKKAPVSDLMKSTWFGSTTSDNTTSRIVANTTTGNFTLETGNSIYIKAQALFTPTNQTTLNIDGSGARNIVAKDMGMVIQPYLQKIFEGQIINLVYDGSYYVVVGTYIEDLPLATSSDKGLVKAESVNEPGSHTLGITFATVSAPDTEKKVVVPSLGDDNKIMGSCIPDATSTVNGGVTFNPINNAVVEINGRSIPTLVLPTNKISPDLLPTQATNVWNDVSLVKTVSGNASGFYVPYLSSTNSTQARLVFASPYGGNVGGLPIYDADGWLYAMTVDNSAPGNAVVNKYYVDSQINTLKAAIRSLGGNV